MTQSEYTNSREFRPKPIHYNNRPMVEVQPPRRFHPALRAIIILTGSAFAWAALMATVASVILLTH